MLDSVKSIAAARQSNGLVAYIALAVYPAYLCVLTYALGLAKAERWGDLLRWFRSEIATGHRPPATAFDRPDVHASLWRLPERELEDLAGLEKSSNVLGRHLAETVVPWGRVIGLSETNARDNLHLVELLGGLVFLGEQSTESLAGRTEPLDMPFGQTMWLRERNDQLFERIGLIRHRDALLKAGFCRGSHEHWDASLHVIGLVAARVGW